MTIQAETAAATAGSGATAKNTEKTTAGKTRTPLRLTKAVSLFQLRTEPELGERIRQAAEADGRTMSSWIRKAVLEKLGRDGF